MLGRLVDLILRATNEEQAVHRVSLLCGVPQIPRKHLEALQANAGHQEIFRVSQRLLVRTNELLGKHRMGPLAIFSETSLGDDVPL